MISSSTRWNINWTDVWKTLRGTLVVFISTFALAAFDVIPGLLTNGITDPKAILLAATVAGSSAVVELLRRYATNYSQPQA